MQFRLDLHVEQARENFPRNLSFLNSSATFSARELRVTSQTVTWPALPLERRSLGAEESDCTTKMIGNERTVWSDSKEGCPVTNASSKTSIPHY